MNKPIKVTGHSLIDYGFLGVAAGGPLLLGLTGPARSIPTAFGALQGTLNALTDQPYAVKRLVPFKLHGRSESLGVPLIPFAVYRSRAYHQPRAGAFFATMLGSLATVYSLTDWDATSPR